MRNKPTFRSKVEYDAYMNYCICIFKTRDVLDFFHTKIEAEKFLEKEKVSGKVLTRKQAKRYGYKF